MAKNRKIGSQEMPTSKCSFCSVHVKMLYLTVNVSDLGTGNPYAVSGGHPVLLP